MPLSSDDLAFLNRFHESRLGKLQTGRTLLAISSVIVATGLILIARSEGLIVLSGIPTLIGAGAAVACLFKLVKYGRQARLIERDLREGHLYHYTILAEESGSFSWMSSSDHPVNGKRIIEVLPVSGKVHRVDESLIWTWMSVQTNK